MHLHKRSVVVAAAAAYILGGCAHSTAPKIDYAALSTELAACNVDAAPAVDRDGKPDPAYGARFMKCTAQGQYQVRIKAPSAGAAPVPSDLSQAIAECSAPAAPGPQRPPDEYANDFINCMSQHEYTISIVYNGITILP